jgi:RNA polymerase sigma factor (sigma-70 family)
MTNQRVANIIRITLNGSDAGQAFHAIRRLPSWTSPFSTAMLEHYYRELLSFIARKVKDRDAAADLAQESYARVIAIQRAGQAVADPRALLYRIARNLVVDRHRRDVVRGETGLPEEDGEQVAEGMTAPPAMSSQGVEALLQTIEALPPRCRETFILYKFDGLSYAQIGERMGISVRTVEMQLQIAMDACWRCLDKTGGHPYAAARPGRKPRGSRK